MGQGIKKISENIISPGRSLTIVNGSIQDNKNFEVGTLKCYPNESGLRYKIGENTYKLFDAINILQEHSIEEFLMDNNSVSTRCLIDQCVTTDKLKDLNVTNAKIENKSINSGIIAYEKIKDNSIISDTLGEQCVINSKIRNKDINGFQKIMNETISTELLKAECVTTAKVANNNITTSKLCDSCVTNIKLADSTIENIKFANFTIQGGNENGIGKIAEKTITNYNIADKTLTDSKFANGCVTGYAVNNISKEYSTIADYTITDLNIANNTISSSKLLSKTIEGAAAKDGGKIAFLSITGDNIKDNSIPLSKLNDSISGVVNGSVQYERDEQNKLCVKLKGKDSNEETCYMDISGHLDVKGNITGARVYNMAYSDLAEGYIPGEKLEPGDTAFLREDGKVYKSGSFCIGAVSDEYAICLGASDKELEKGIKVAIAAIGKVHVKTEYDTVLGSTVYGYAGKPLGKALESKKKSKSDKYHKVLCLVRPY